MEKIDAEPESEEEREDTVDFSLFDVSKKEKVDKMLNLICCFRFPEMTRLY